MTTSASTKRLRKAARWYDENTDIERAFVPVLFQVFRLAARDAIEAAKLTNEIAFSPSAGGGRP